MKEHYRYTGLRLNLVTELRNKGIKDERVLAAIMNVPRHLFLDRAFADWAYRDQAFPIDANQTISQPYTVALQTTLLELKGKEKVLEIGTGSGYQACVLAEMGVKLYTIERQEILFRKTDMLLQSLGYGRIRTLFGDGYKGAPRFAPFDKIIVTAGSTVIPKTLCEQLRIGGTMVIPVGKNEVEQQMFKITRLSERKYHKENFGKCAFVPFLSGVASAR